MADPFTYNQHIINGSWYRVCRLIVLQRNFQDLKTSEFYFFPIGGFIEHGTRQFFLQIPMGQRLV